MDPPYKRYNIYGRIRDVNLFKGIKKNGCGHDLYFKIKKIRFLIISDSQSILLFSLKTYCVFFFL